MKGKIFPICVALFLFFLPFFWFKPGRMDLGGDSSRLYFYDPIGYLRNYSLFAVSPSSVGTENIGFMTIPLVLIFAFIKKLGISSTYLINGFHGLSFASAFFFVYLSITQLLQSSARNQRYSEISGLIGGLLYIFSPVSIYGWDKALITHNHVFLNPILFYLLLRYMLTDRVMYLFFSLLLTFIFSANFSFVAAPVFFAFYPATLIFLLIYKRRVLKTSIHWKQIFLAFACFILLHSFHIFPQIASMVTPGSVLYTSVFSDEGKYDRGLGYFSAIAPSIKASVNIFLMPQMSRTSAFLLFMLMVPLTLVIALIRSSTEDLRYRKTIVLVGMIFLTIFFFATANITDVGLSVYKKLFMLPGFSIYRNFYGQWASAFFFYYTLLFGLALVVVVPIHKRFRIALGIFVAMMLINAWPFLNGSLINPVLWKSTNSRIAMNMDPAFIQSIEYMHQLPTDGKVLTLPLTDPGYQIVAGKDTGAYQGPSMISYLAGKQDFAGALELGRFSALFLESVKNGDVNTIKKILGILNIRYIYYNNDPRVYDAFPSFPYDDVRKYFPKDQEGYEAFVRSLSLPLLQSFGNRFFVYELPKENITPRVYIPERAYAISRKEHVSTLLSLEATGADTSALFEGVAMDLVDTTWYPLSDQNTLLRMVKNPDPPRLMHHAFATTPVSSVFYPLITGKEMWKLNKADKAGYLSAIDQRAFLSAKRILEIEQWGEGTPVLGTIRSLSDLGYAKTLPGQSFDASLILNVSAWQKLHSWEALLSRYYVYFDTSIRLIENANESELWKAEQRFIVSEYLRQHQRRIMDVIRTHSSLGYHKDYLLRVTQMLFGDLLQRTWTDLSGISVPYVGQLPAADNFLYELYMDTTSLDSNASVSVSDGNAVYRSSSLVKSRWERLGTVTRTSVDKPIVVQVSTASSKNLITEDSRMPLEVVSPHVDGGMVNTDMRYIKNARGIAWKIDDWQPKSYYLLKFRYKTESEPFSVRVLESDTKANSVIIPATLVDDMLLSSEWREYQAVIRSDVLANTGYVQITPVEGQTSVSRIELKNVSLTHVQHPYVALVQKSDQKNETQPNVSFIQADPTLYTVRIRGAVTPYFLVLSEDANSRWRLAVLPKSKKERETFWDTMLDFIDRIVPRHRKIIATDHHYSANVYANAWYIKPEDVSGQQEYELELYMTTQSYFYVGAAASIGALIGLMLYGVWKYFINKYKK